MVKELIAANDKFAFSTVEGHNYEMSPYCGTVNNKESSHDKNIAPSDDTKS